MATVAKEIEAELRKKYSVFMSVKDIHRELGYTAAAIRKWADKGYFGQFLTMPAGRGGRGGEMRFTTTSVIKFAQDRLIEPRNQEEQI